MNVWPFWRCCTIPEIGWIYLRLFRCYSWRIVEIGCQGNFTWRYGRCNSRGWLWLHSYRHRGWLWLGCRGILWRFWSWLWFQLHWKRRSAFCAISEYCIFRRRGIAWGWEWRWRRNLSDSRLTRRRWGRGFAARITSRLWYLCWRGSTAACRPGSHRSLRCSIWIYWSSSLVRSGNRSTPTWRPAVLSGLLL